MVVLFQFTLTRSHLSPVCSRAPFLGFIRLHSLSFGPTRYEDAIFIKYSINTIVVFNLTKGVNFFFHVITYTLK